MKHRRWTPEEKQFIEDNIAGRSYKNFADLFNKHFGLEISLNALRTACCRQGLYNGMPSRFGYGRIPPNKGKKVKPPSPFKPGNTIRCVPIGSEFINYKGYTFLKIAQPSVWRRKHIVIWEASNGPVPKDHMILFADGNKSNMNLDNLLLVSRRELAAMNKKHLIFPDADATRAGLLIAKIIIQINNRTNMTQKYKMKRGVQ